MPVDYAYLGEPVGRRLAGDLRSCPDQFACVTGRQPIPADGATTGSSGTSRRARARDLHGRPPTGRRRARPHGSGCLPTRWPLTDPWPGRSGSVSYSGVRAARAAAMAANCVDAELLAARARVDPGRPQALLGQRRRPGPPGEGGAQGLAALRERRVDAGERVPPGGRR